MNTGRSFGVFCGAGSWPFGLVCCKTPEKPLPGALTLKNRVNPCQTMEATPFLRAVKPFRLPAFTKILALFVKILFL